jgi:hypothetical protein
MKLPHRRTEKPIAARADRIAFRHSAIIARLTGWAIHVNIALQGGIRAQWNS